MLRKGFKMPTTEVLMGNHATSWGVKLARTEVIAAYPITPQTQVVEELSEMCARKELTAKFIKVESEHSAMACCIGASQAGVRTFTATSSQGLALMHELLFWAAYGRLPIVLCNVNRAMAPGWNIWSDQTDSLAQRDTGWIQIYCETNQEVLDTVIMAFKLAESVDLPVMVVYDAFILSHTYEPVEIPDQKDVDDFLPKRKADFSINTKEPRTYNSLVTPEHYMEFRHIMEEAHQGTFEVYDKVAKEFSKSFGRHHKIAELINADDADTLIVTTGSTTSTARVAVKNLRNGGEKVGLLKLRMFRPFPVSAIKEALCNNKKITKVAVLDRNISHGAGGIWAQEIKAALSGSKNVPEIFSFHIGLGGRDITPESITEAYIYTKNHERSEAPVWIGLKNSST
jgi:Pyruvate:ferredoxin oxidoreductase and related 2-oxoacid:ferredoxin oxidoreductases, alpha subunit